MAGNTTFSPTIEDHVVAQRLWLASYWRRPQLRVMAGLCAIVFVMGVGLSIYELLVERRSLAAVLSEMYWPLAAPVIFAALQFAGWALIPRSVARMSRENPVMLSATTWCWNDDGVVSTSAAGGTNVRWADIHRVLDGRNSIVLQPTERMLLVLPLRSIPAAEVADLRTTIARFARTGAAA